MIQVLLEANEISYALIQCFEFGFDEADHVLDIAMDLRGGLFSKRFVSCVKESSMTSPIHAQAIRTSEGPSICTQTFASRISDGAYMGPEVSPVCQQ